MRPRRRSLRAAQRRRKASLTVQPGLLSGRSSEWLSPGHGRSGLTCTSAEIPFAPYSLYTECWVLFLSAGYLGFGSAMFGTALLPQWPFAASFFVGRGGGTANATLSLLRCGPAGASMHWRSQARCSPMPSAGHRRVRRASRTRLPKSHPRTLSISLPRPPARCNACGRSV
jgi:hypothetical protein